MLSFAQNENYTPEDLFNEVFEDKILEKWK